MIKIKIEGPIASGKTTIMKLIKEKLEDEGYNVEECITMKGEHLQVERK